MATRTTTKSTKRKSTSAGPRRAATTSRAKTSAVKSAAPVSAASPKTVAEVVEASVEEKIIPVADNAKVSNDDPSRLKRPDLIEAIAGRVSLKRSEAKMVMDVVLDELGKALDGTEEVVVPPLGKLMVKKRDQKPGGMMLTLKLKRADHAPEAGDVPPLAEIGAGS